MHAWTCRACPCMPVHTVSFLTGELGKEKETAWEGSSGVEVTLPFLRNVPRSSGTENYLRPVIDYQINPAPLGAVIIFNDYRPRPDPLRWLLPPTIK